MTTELWMLIGAVAVLMALIACQTFVLLITFGLARAAGNRDDIPVPQPGLAGRAQRTVSNHVQGLAIFAPLVLTAAVSGISNEWTVLGAQIFVASRIGHAITYLAGIRWVRSAIFGVGVASLFMFVYGLIGM